MGITPGGIAGDLENVQPPMDMGAPGTPEGGVAGTPATATGGAGAAGNPIAPAI